MQSDDAKVRQYCSEQTSSEPLGGTADSVDVWLLLEYRPTWKPRVLEDNDLASATRTWVADTLAGLKRAGLRARPQFIRQPESTREDTRLLVATGDRLLEFSGTGYGFLKDVDLPSMLAEDAVEGGRACEPHYLVCTNGQRDVCCARFGLPVYAALSERLGERVWQVSHLGGHRFAPNVLVVPDACLYGRIDVDGLDEFLAVTEAGQTDFRHLRGRTCYEPAVQFAEASLGIANLELRDVTENEATSRVTFSVGDELRSVSVRRSSEPMAVTKSCGDEPVAVHPFVAG